MRARAAIVAAMSLGLAGCSSDASVETAPLAVARAAHSSIATQQRASQRSARAVTRRSAVPPRGTSAREPATPQSSPSARSAPSSTPVPVSGASRLAAPACAQYTAALAGRFPAPVLARGEESALAVVTDAVAAALLGLPVVAPRASLTAREALGDAHARISRALAARENGQAIARATRARIEAYAHALGIAACG